MISSCLGLQTWGCLSPFRPDWSCLLGFLGVLMVMVMVLMVVSKHSDKSQTGHLPLGQDSRIQRNPYWISSLNLVHGFLS